jgi:hypothetical protein
MAVFFSERALLDAASCLAYNWRWKWQLPLKRLFESHQTVPEDWTLLFSSVFNSFSFSLCLTNKALYNEDVWWSECIDPRILDIDTRWRWVVSFTYRPLYFRGKKNGIHWIGCWVCPRSSLGGVERRISCPIPAPLFDYNEIWSTVLKNQSDDIKFNIVFCTFCTNFLTLNTFSLLARFPLTSPG